jgi:Glycosyltransferase family 87
METSQANTRNWRFAIACAALLALSLKIYLALSTIGTNDILTWQSFLNNITQFGGIGTYQRPGVFGDPFNHPPFMIHVLKSLEYLSSLSGLPFSFWLRLPAIIADIGSLWLSFRMKAPPLMLFLFALCPASILISGFHGNTDPVMVFFVLLSIFFVDRKNSEWLGGLAFGMALNIKVVPLIFVPAIFFFLPERKKALQFFSAALGTIVICSLPYIFNGPILIARKTLGYGGLYNRWGWSLILSFLFPSAGTTTLLGYDAGSIHLFLSRYFKYALMALIAILSWWMNRESNRKPSLFFQCGTIVSLFLMLTPGFGVQYLAWLVPFVIALRTLPTLFYYLTSGAYLFATYRLWSDGNWYYADSIKVRPPMLSVYLLSLLCWLAVVFTCWRYLRTLSTYSRSHLRKL